jgi:hypothetical protein
VRPDHTISNKNKMIDDVTDMMITTTVAERTSFAEGHVTFFSSLDTSLAR